MKVLIYSIAIATFALSSCLSESPDSQEQSSPEDAARNAEETSELSQDQLARQTRANIPMEARKAFAKQAPIKTTKIVKANQSRSTRMISSSSTSSKEATSSASSDNQAVSFGLIGDANATWDTICPDPGNCNLNSEYEKTTDLEIDIDKDTDSGVSTLPVIDLNEPDPNDICLANPGDGGQAGGSSGEGDSQASDPTTEITQDIILVDNRSSLFEREALLEVFVAEATDVELDPSITTEEWQELQAKILGAQTELFYAYMNLYKSESDGALRCRYAKKAEAIMQEIDLNPSAVIATHADLKSQYDSLSQSFRDAVIRNAVCGDSRQSTTAGTLSLIQSYVKTKLEGRVIEELVELQTFVGAQLTVLQDLLDQMEVTINTAGVLELKRDVANMTSNLQMVAGPSGEAGGNGLMADSMGLSAKLGTEFDSSDIGGQVVIATADVNGQIKEIDRRWDLSSWDYKSYLGQNKNWQEDGAPKSCETYDSNAPVVSKIACLEALLLDGSHPDLVALATNINQVRSASNNFLTEFVSIAETAKLTESDSTAPACIKLTDFVNANPLAEDPSANTPITVDQGTPFPPAVLSLLQANSVPWEGKTNNQIRAALLVLLKDNYEQCLAGIRGAVQASKTDTSLYEGEITAFAQHLDEYSRELLKVKQWAAEEAK